MTSALGARRDRIPTPRPRAMERDAGSLPGHVKCPLLRLRALVSSDPGHPEPACTSDFLVVDDGSAAAPSPYASLPGEELQPRLHHEELRSRPQIADAGVAGSLACHAYEDAWAPYAPGGRTWSRGHQRRSPGSQRKPANLPASAHSAPALQAQAAASPPPPDDPWAEPIEHC